MCAQPAWRCSCLQVALCDVRNLLGTFVSACRCISVHCAQAAWHFFSAFRCLQEDQMGGNDEIAAMDRDLPESTILLFRRLAHAKVGVGGKQLLT